MAEEGEKSDENVVDEGSSLPVRSHSGVLSILRTSAPVLH